MDDHPLIALQRQRDDQRDRADRAEDRIREAIRWCELIAGSKSPGASTAAQILGILKGEKSTGPPIQFTHTHEVSKDDSPPQPSIRFDTSETDPDLVDVVFLQGEQEVHRVKDLTEAEILESFGVAREKSPALSLSR